LQSHRGVEVNGGWGPVPSIEGRQGKVGNQGVHVRACCARADAHTPWSQQYIPLQNQAERESIKLGLDVWGRSLLLCHEVGPGHEQFASGQALVSTCLL